MKTKTEYENKTLQEYKTKYLWRDKIRYGLTDLQQADRADLEQELNLTGWQLLKQGNCLMASDIQTYCNKAYQNTVRRYAKNFIRNSKMKCMDHKDLCDYLSTHSWDDEVNRAFYWEWDSLQGLTDMEQAVMTLKANGYYHEEIKRLTKYQGTLSGLRNVYERARKKVLAKYPLTGPEQGF